MLARGSSLRSRYPAIAIGLIIVLGGFALIGAGIVVGQQIRDSKSDASPTAAANDAALQRSTLVSGATVALPLTSGSQVKVTIVNVWQGDNGPNVVVRVTGKAFDVNAWTFLLNDGTTLAPVASANGGDNDQYLRLEHGVPAGRTVSALLYTPGGPQAITFDAP
jgi:hypothetical protein